MINRIKELVAALNEAARAYYQQDRELMSNREYDSLYDELTELEKKTGIILAGSPTQRVGYTVLSDLKKVRHESPILSLDKTKEVEKLKSFIGSEKGILSWKLDGLTIVLTFQNGELSQAITRGNGEIGEDVTHNARVFSNIPLKIPFKGTLALRGEGVISYSEFGRINSELGDEEEYKNPRNLCSGTVRQLNSEIAAKRQVRFIAFTLVSAEGHTLSDSKAENMEWLKELGFETVEYKMVTADNIEAEVEWFRSNIAENDIASDGLVLTFDSLALSRSLGRTAKFPKDSIAFKWADETAETVLRDIEWNTSRTGLMNPIAVFDPVELEGSTVSRASVHNVSILKELKLGVGDRLRVYKANMIIPQISENLTCSDTALIPERCFVCGGETRLKKRVDGEALYCTNPECSAQIIRRLSHFVSRDAMNIEGLSEETIRKFTEKGFIKQYPDIFRLKEHENEIKTMEGFGERSCNNLLASVEKAKTVEMPNFIYALGIDQVGLRNAKLLCGKMNNSMERILNASEEELQAIDGFGGVIAHSIYVYFHNDTHLQLLKEAMEHIRMICPDAADEGDMPLKDISFVITGDLVQFTNRKELTGLIEKLGGKVTGSVTSKTDFLINNDTASSSSKNKKAKELNITILNEEEFINRFQIKL